MNVYTVSTAQGDDVSCLREAVQILLNHKEDGGKLVRRRLIRLEGDLPLGFGRADLLVSFGPKFLESISNLLDIVVGFLTLLNGSGHGVGGIFANNTTEGISCTFHDAAGDGITGKIAGNVTKHVHGREKEVLEAKRVSLHGQGMDFREAILGFNDVSFQTTGATSLVELGLSRIVPAINLGDERFAAKLLETFLPSFTAVASATFVEHMRRGYRVVVDTNEVKLVFPEAHAATKAKNSGTTNDGELGLENGLVFLSKFGDFNLLALADAKVATEPATRVGDHVERNATVVFLGLDENT